MGYGILKKMVQGRTQWTRSKYLLITVDVMSRCSFSVDFYAYSSSCYCTIVASSSSLMIICSFSPILCIPSYSSRCITKAIWASLEIVALYSSGLEMENAPIIYEESWSTICLEQICCDLFPAVSFENLSSSCCNNAASHWPRRWVDGVQCKYKQWFVF